MKIRRSELLRLEAHAREGYPHEVVGILAGDRETGEVTRVSPLVNERADSPANRYHVSAPILMRAERALEAAGLAIVGYYHTHPDHPARYSDFDRDHALPNLSYLIVSVRGGEIADRLCWRLREDRGAMDPETVEILEDPLVTFHVHTALRPYTGQAAAVQVPGATVGEALAALLAAHPGLAGHLRDANGKLRSFVNIYLGDEDIRTMQGEATPVREGAELILVPSIAGGLS